MDICFVTMSWDVAWMSSRIMRFVSSFSSSFSQYLESVRPLLDSKEYSRMEFLAHDFQETEAAQFQRYLLLKSWWATNYVSGVHTFIQCNSKFTQFIYSFICINNAFTSKGKWLVGGIHLLEEQKSYNGQQQLLHHGKVNYGYVCREKKLLVMLFMS